MQLNAGAGSGFWGAEVDPDSSEAFEHLERRLFVVDPKQCLEPLLEGKKTHGTRFDRFQMPLKFNSTCP